MSQGLLRSQFHFRLQDEICRSAPSEQEKQWSACLKLRDQQADTREAQAMEEQWEGGCLWECDPSLWLNH